MPKGVDNETRFAKVEKMFRAAINQFLKKYRSRMYRIYAEEMVSAAGEGLMDAITTFDPKLKTKFSTWMWKKVWGKMMDDLRKAFRRSNRTFAQVYDLEAEQEPPTFDRDEFMARLTPDGRTAASLVLDCPIELEFLKVLIGPDSPDNTREAVRQFLVQEEGWTKIRVTRAFAEVKAALR